MNDKQLKAVAMPGDFIFHSSWFEIFKSFDMATAYAIFMAMIAYVQTGTVPDDEALRRLTVFLFAHIDTDRQRLLSLQPKRRTPAKKTPAPEPSSPEPPSPEPKPTEAPTPETKPAQASHNSHNSQSSYNSHNSQNGPRTQAVARRARFLHYAQRVSAAIRQGQHLPDPTRVHKRNFKKRFKKNIPHSSLTRRHGGPV